MKQYILKGNQGNECLFTFNQDGVLCEFKAAADINAAALIWLLERLPKYNNTLAVIAKQNKMELVEVPLDLSFENFWNSYNHKIGNKDRSRKLWEKLSDADKVRSLVVIPRYDTYLKAKNGIEKLYPETFLNQRRFENDFKY